MTPSEGRRLFLWVLISTLMFWVPLLVWLFWMISPAYAHQAPTGWTYDYACCSNRDCRPIPYAEVNEGNGGYSYHGQTIPYGDSRIRQSLDENFHICTIGGKPGGRVLCIYEPVRGF